MIIDLKQKSQVTIPKKIIEKLKLKVGDKINIEEKGGRLKNVSDLSFEEKRILKEKITLMFQNPRHP